MSEQDRSLAGTTEQRVAAALRDQILNGALAIGEHLRQDSISAEFGVSSTPVREAFRRLSAEGLLTISSHRGAIVRDMSLLERIELMELLRTIEALNVEAAVLACTPDDLAEAEATQEQLRASTDPVQWALLNRDFHWFLDRPSGRPRTLALLHELLTLTSLHIRDEVASRSGRREQALEEHDAILRAFRDGQVETAREVLHTHATIAIEWLEASLAAALPVL
jgi:DNA-binding GntR family transcriptional regulator